MNTLVEQASRSWHIPDARWGHHREFDGPELPLVYLQILPKQSREAIKARVVEYDREWSQKLTDRFGTHFEVPTVVEYPYIRDNAMTPAAVCVFLQRLQKRRPNSGTAILVDSDVDDDSCIIVSWGTYSNQLMVSAARVQQEIARPLLATISDGLASSVEHALGEDYEDAQVDLALEYSAAIVHPKMPAFEAPTFLPRHLSLCTEERLTIIPLTSLSDETKASLQQTIETGSYHADAHVQILDWQGPPASRPHLYQLHKWLESNSAAGGTIGYAFYVDPILQDHDGQPSIIAASRTSTYTHALTDNQIEIVPVRKDKLVSLWRTAVQGIEDKSNADLGRSDGEWLADKIRKNVKETRTVDPVTIDRSGSVLAAERVYDPRFAFRDREETKASVWFLRNFNEKEQRHIRAALAKPCEYEKEDYPKAFIYMGYVFPDDGKTTHTFEDLRDLFQKCDPYSPFYNPEYSDFRLDGYPRNFVVVDDRALDQVDPYVIMGTTIDLYFDGHQLGWYKGMVKMNEAYNAWCNLDIANSGPEEIFEDAEVVWLSDLIDFKAAYEGVETGYELDY